MGTAYAVFISPSFVPLDVGNNRNGRYSFGNQIPLSTPCCGGEDTTEECIGRTFSECRRCRVKVPSRSAVQSDLKAFVVLYDLYEKVCSLTTPNCIPLASRFRGTCVCLHLSACSSSYALATPDKFATKPSANGTQFGVHHLSSAWSWMFCVFCFGPSQRA